MKQGDEKVFGDLTRDDFLNARDALTAKAHRMCRTMHERAERLATRRDSLADDALDRFETEAREAEQSAIDGLAIRANTLHEIAARFDAALNEGEAR